jgi:hypothetical protein
MRKAALLIVLLAVAVAPLMGQKNAPPASRGDQPAQSAPAGQRQKLVMKDGSYQLVRGYQVQGDRVRYYSIERDGWEEVPASLVDWEATEQTNRAESAAADEALTRARAAGEEDKESRQAADQILGSEIAPGLFIPDEDGIYVIKSGKVLALPRQEAKERVDKGRMATNVLLPVPVLKNRNLVEIAGARAPVRLEASPAALYASGRTRDDSRFALARLKAKGDARQVEAILTNILGRNPTHSGDYIELKSETIAPNVFRLTPARPLPPGEYAIVEFLGNDLNMFLWDFAVEK